MPSDDFTRKDEITALFHEWECIGTAAIRWVDLSSPICRDDSYFAIWSDATIEAAIAHGPRICIASSFVVATPWRRARGGRVRDLLGALVVERFQQSQADTLVATVRNDHGMNALCYKLGLIPLARNAILHGVPVDLVADWRLCNQLVLATDLADGILGVMNLANPYVLRSANLVRSDMPTALMQVMRLVSEAQLKVRRIFSSPNDLSEWLREVTTAEEQARLTLLLARGDRPA